MRVVVVGAGFAGLLAARKIARHAEVTLVNPNAFFVERVRLHQVATGQKLRRRRIEDVLRGTGVRFLETSVEKLDLQQRQVEAGGQPLPYDQLVWAAGSHVDDSLVPGAREHTESVRGETGAAALCSKLVGLAPGGRVVICGGGLTGLELASEVAQHFPKLSLTLVTDGELAQSFAPKARAYFRATFQRLQIAVRDRVRVAAFHPGEVELQGGERLASDVNVWVGAFGLSPLCGQAGLAVNARGQVLVDPALRSVSHPEVWAVGDAAMPAVDPGAVIRMGCATAMPMAAHAAANLAAVIRGKMPHPFHFAYAAQFVSLGRGDAVAQFTRHDDSPRRWVLTGRLAAWIKELTFRANMMALHNGIYPWQLLLIGAPPLPEAARRLALPP